VPSLAHIPSPTLRRIAPNRELTVLTATLRSRRVVNVTRKGMAILQDRAIGDRPKGGRSAMIMVTVAERAAATKAEPAVAVGVRDAVVRSARNVLGKTTHLIIRGGSR
jgi:hypothetical protein